MTWAAAKAEIRRIEQALKLELARAQRGSERWLVQERSTLWRAVRMERLRARMRRAILASGRRAYRAGYRVADRVVERRRSAARFRGTEEEPPPPIPQAWITWYEGTIDEALGRYTDRVRQDVAQLTQRGAIEGWTIEQLTREVRGIVSDMVTWRAERIARTETMRLWNVGSYSRMEEEDEDLIGYEYSVVLDDRTSHVCRPLRGKRVRREELKYVPPLHPHCRTNLEPVFAFDAGAEGVEWSSPDDAAGVPGFGLVPRPPVGLGALPRRLPMPAPKPEPVPKPEPPADASESVQLTAIRAEALATEARFRPDDIDPRLTRATSNLQYWLDRENQLAALGPKDKEWAEKKIAMWRKEVARLQPLAALPEDTKGERDAAWRKAHDFIGQHETALHAQWLTAVASGKPPDDMWFDIRVWKSYETMVDRYTQYGEKLLSDAFATKNGAWVRELADTVDDTARKARSAHEAYVAAGSSLTGFQPWMDALRSRKDAQKALRAPLREMLAETITRIRGPMQGAVPENCRVNASGAQRAKLERALVAATELFPPKWRTILDRRLSEVRWSTARAHYASTTIRVDDREETMAHELFHAIEDDAHERALSQAFLSRRTQGEPLKKLKDLQPGYGYGRDEKARPDKFCNPYVGKHYADGATEVGSVGIEGLIYGEDNIYGADREHAAFMLGRMATNL